jgi:hypothetical protein
VKLSAFVSDQLHCSAASSKYGHCEFFFKTVRAKKKTWQSFKTTGYCEGRMTAAIYSTLVIANEAPDRPAKRGNLYYVLWSLRMKRPLGQWNAAIFHSIPAIPISLNERALPVNQQIPSALH